MSSSKNQKTDFNILTMEAVRKYAAGNLKI